MKKYIIFALSFIVFFVVFQILSGYFLTLFYTPDIMSAWDQAEGSSSNVVIKGGSSFIPLLIAFLAATIAYFTPRMFIKNNSK